MSLYLAIDAGGTKTTALLANETEVLARAAGGSIKTLRVAPSDAALHLQALLGELEAAASLPIRGAVVRTCMGTSGVSAPAVREWLRAALADAVGGELLLVGDEVIALDAAFASGRGVVVIAGTGSNIVARARTGAMVHTGGWGPALADEGSGHWIGTEALRASFRAIDAAAPSTADAVHPHSERVEVTPEHLPPLLRGALELYGLRTLNELIGRANSPGFPSAALVPLVAEAARAGDVRASEVLRQAGSDLAGLVSAAIRKMEVLEHGFRFLPPEVAFAGGILTSVAEVRSAMHAGLRQRFPGIRLRQQPLDPLAGALWRARGCPPLARGMAIVSDGNG